LLLLLLSLYHDDDDDEPAMKWSKMKLGCCSLSQHSKLTPALSK